jgi:hypothetical protein
LDDNIEATRAPESDDVTKKVIIKIKEITDKVNEKLIESYNTNNAVLAFSLTAPAMSEILFTSKYIAELPKTPIHIKTINEGINRTPTMNSLIVLPYEILAINKETKGAQANHHVK